MFCRSGGTLEYEFHDFDHERGAREHEENQGERAEMCFEFVVSHILFNCTMLADSVNVEGITLAWVETLIAAGAAIGGVWLGQRLSRSARVEERIRDAKKEEYKEVLTVLANAYLDLLRHGKQNPCLPDDIERHISDSEAESYRVLHDRLYIAIELENANISKLWTIAVENFMRGDPEDPEVRRKFSERFTGIRNGIVNLARKDV